MVICSKQGTVVIRPLAADDPRNIDHSSHREQWLALADALGRMDAREAYAKLQKRKTGKNDEEPIDT